MNQKIRFSALLLIAAFSLGALAAEPSTGNAADARAGNANASDAKEQTPPLFSQLDTNHDGYVTLEEAKRSAEITARFKELDLDRDGKISVVEFKNGAQAKM